MVSMADRTETAATNFNAIRISIASPEQILNWSHGEVTKPETINYRTLRPEKDGLFCERLFGPTKDWECFCGKYKRIRYRGVVCDRCGVEVTRAKVRRERMGHIRLAAPVAHIWFSKTNPSRLGLLLDLSPRNLERVLYFAQHIIISVDEEARQEAIEAEQLKYDLDIEKRREVAADRLAELNVELLRLTGGRRPETNNPAKEFAPEDGEPVAELLEVQQQMDTVSNQLATDETELASQLKQVMDDISDIQKMRLLAESRYRELNDRYPEVFVAGMGAEAILAILRDVNLEALRDQLITDMHSTSGQRRQKAIKRLRVVESFRQSGGRGEDGHRQGTRVEDMILTVMPVLPPELRPMVQLDGGRFATSDLNDLYRRVINRNNRLKRLMSLGAPEIIIRNEKRMLQEAVDALIDNGRRGRPIQGSHNHKLKSLSDLLRGKQGRFRQNLLGKRVDYSGRSVIVVGPELKMNECGLPRRMALELFKPFVMHRLVVLGIAPNIKNAKRMVERARGEVWDILEDVIKNRPVLLNRAPTLHRLGIQAFMPVLIDGHAIQIHPLVCSAFNADFDGDQMAVHVPLSRMAVLEAQEAMLSTHNMLSPASGDPLVAPTLDMVMGCYYLTEIDERPDIKGTGRRFSDINEAREAYADGDLDLRARIYVRHIRGGENRGGFYSTTLGRLVFNEILPAKFVHNDTLSEEARIQNKQIDRGALNDLTADLYRTLSNDETAEALDAIKDLGFQYATSSGITIAINDIQVSAEKANVLAEAESKVDQYNEEYQMGLISEEERYDKTIEAWAQASFETAELVGKDTASYGGIGTMALSGTKGNTSQINQMAGMRGLINRPRSGVIELPVKSNFREGLSALEYFISTHGARKGLTDTALNTASSGYLTRRLIDIAQEVFIQGEDCGTLDGWAPRRPAPSTRMTLRYRVSGRRAAMTMADPETGEVLVERNETITPEKADQLIERGVTEIMVRSPLTCESPRGVCRMCYGDLAATGQLVQEGQAVGIIAAQSIGEPGTQLTMRTFHTGGVRRTHSREDEIDLQKARDMLSFINRVRNEGESLRASIQLPFDRVIETGSADPRLAYELSRFRDELPGLTGSIGRIQGNSETYRFELRSFADTFPDTDDFYRPTLERLIGRISVAPAEIGRMAELCRSISNLPAPDATGHEHPLPEDGEAEVAGGDTTDVRTDTLQDLTGRFEETARTVFAWMQNTEANIRDALQTIAGQLREDVEFRNLDITGGLPMVEEVFEARVPKNAAIVSDIDGTVELVENEDNTTLRVVYRDEIREEYPLPEGAEVVVEDGDTVEPGSPLAVVSHRDQYALPEGFALLVDDGEEVQPDMVLASFLNADSDGESAPGPLTAVSAGRVEVSGEGLTVVSPGQAIESTVAGRVEVAEGYITVIWEDEEAREYSIPASVPLMVRDNDQVNAGDALTGGPRNPHDILRIQGKEDLQKRMIDQVQAVYQSQGVTIHDKHIEIILRQMLRRVQVREPGDTDFIPGEVQDKFAFQEHVEQVLAEGGEPATADQVLLGVTRASLRTDSFLSAASFQETTRVLTEAAVRGQQDYLLGLKENVIIGRLIPAQVEIPGMAELLKPQPALDLAAVSPGGWLRGPSETDEADTDLGILGPDPDDDGFERMARAVARSYANEDTDDDELDEFVEEEDDDGDEEAEATVSTIGLTEEVEEEDTAEHPED